jgi:hypothetical protein
MSKVIVWSRDRGPDLSMLPLRELKDINLDFVQPAIGQRASKQSPEAHAEINCPVSKQQLYALVDLEIFPLSFVHASELSCRQLCLFSFSDALPLL